MADIEALKASLGDIPLITDPTKIQLRSRDFYWYSPVLKRQLESVCADLVVEPRDEAEVIRTLAACHRRRVPVTVAGRPLPPNLTQYRRRPRRRRRSAKSRGGRRPGGLTSVVHPNVVARRPAGTGVRRSAGRGTRDGSPSIERTCSADWAGSTKPSRHGMHWHAGRAGPRSSQPSKPPNCASIASPMSSARWPPWSGVCTWPIVAGHAACRNRRWRPTSVTVGGASALASPAWLPERPP